MYTVKYFGFDKTAIQKVEYPDKIQFFNDAGTEVHVINRRAPRSDFLLVNHKIICEADQPELSTTHVQNITRVVFGRVPINVMQYVFQ
jgi:hypothetical protein